MAYRKSSARIEFENKSSELLQLAKNISYKRVKLSYKHKNLIYQAAIVLLCASFEEYLKCFVEDLIYQYKTKSAKLSELPQNIRAYGLLVNQQDIFKRFFISSGEKPALDELNNSSRFIYSILNDDEVFNNHIHSQSIHSKRKYPNPNNIKILYNRLGISNIFSRINSRGRKDYELIVSAFLDVRSSIAHQAIINLTIEDIERHFVNVIDVINQLDRIAHSHCCKVSNSKYWPSA